MRNHKWVALVMIWSLTAGSGCTAFRASLWPNQTPPAPAPDESTGAGRLARDVLQWRATVPQCGQNSDGSQWGPNRW